MTLSIIVGKKSSPQAFHIHESLAVKLSDFFAAAVRKGWKESIKRTVKLPEEDPELFRIFEAFIYSGRVYSQKDGDEYEDENGRSVSWEFGRLMSLWLLGDRLQASAFKDAIVDTLIEKINSEGAVPMKSFAAIYEGSVHPSPMKELLVETAAREWDTEDIDDIDMDETGSAFIKDLAKAQRKYLADGIPESAPYWEGPTCMYHEHAENKPCYKAMFK